MRVIPLTDVHARRAAAVLHDASAPCTPQPWPTLADALAEVQHAFAADRVALAAMDDDRLVGWAAALPTSYGGQTWELHPLVVDPPAQGAGVGTALVDGLLERLGTRAAGTLLVSTTDGDRATSIGGIDLFPGVLDHLRTVRERRRHPLGFLRRCGFEVVGVVPDAAGPGRHDILLATRVPKAAAALPS